MIRKCALCGKEFESTRPKKYCDDIHFKNCVICGSKFQVDLSNLSKDTCSRKCGIEKANRARAAKRLAKVDADPNKVKGGKYTRICIICGEEFHTSSKTRKLCYISHTRDCYICGKPFPLNVYSSDTVTCSSKCASELRVQRNLEKYGVRSTAQLEEVKEKARQNNIKKYGVDNPMKSKEILDRIKQSNLEKYGVEWSVQREDVKLKSQQTNLERRGVPYSVMSSEVKEKTRQTNLERRGVEHVFQDPEFRQQAKEACLERYGTEYYLQSQDFKEKSQAVWLKNYGVDNPLKSKEVRKIGEQTSLQKYGTCRPQQNDEIRNQIRMTNILNHANTIQDKSKRTAYLKFKQDPKSYVEEALKNTKLGVSAISHNTGLADETLILEVIHDYNLEDLMVSRLPRMEQEITCLIHDIDPEIKIIHHDRHIIGPKEIDIYLPDYKLGIECNPTVTHNSTFVLGNQFGDKNCPVTPRDYHLNKTLKAQDNGIFLFHIFGYEWSNKQNIIESMICNLLSSSNERIYARNLVVKEVSLQESNKFLNDNHRQGSLNSSIRLGLYDKSNCLVSLMTFGNMRRTIGDSKSDTDKTYELSRFCSKLNTSVVGGASKLFKYFLKNYQYDKIVSFSDRAHTKGTVYKLLGFTPIHMSDPNYCWVNYATDLYFNRVACQKRNLRKLFKDDTIDIENKTEQQIMIEHGFVQVYDSGTIRWEYENR